MDIVRPEWLVDNASNVELKRKVQACDMIAPQRSPQCGRVFEKNMLLKVVCAGSPCGWEQRTLREEEDICTITLEAAAWRIIEEDILKSEVGANYYSLIEKIIRMCGEDCEIADVATFYNHALTSDPLNYDIIKDHPSVPVAIKILLIPDSKLKVALFKERVRIFDELLSNLPLQYLCSMHAWTDGFAGGLSEEKVSTIRHVHCVSMNLITNCSSHSWNMRLYSKRRMKNCPACFFLLQSNFLLLIS